MNHFYYDAPSTRVKTLPGSQKWKWIVLVLLLTLPGSGFPAWEKVSGLPSTEAAIDLASVPNSDPDYYAATPHAVFKNESGRWQTVFSLSHSQDKIARISASSESHQSLWIQTKQSVFEWTTQTRSVKRVYESHDEEKAPLAFFAGKETWWIGTARGLWSAQKNTSAWRKQSELADSLPVFLIAESSIGLFFSADGDWRLAGDDSVQTVLKIFDFGQTADDTDDLPKEFEDENSQISRQTFFDFIETEESFYLATSKGVFQSRNGLDWQLLPGSGLRNALPKRLAWNFKTKQLIGIGEGGFFIFNNSDGKWQIQNDGLAKTHVFSALHLKNSDALLAVNAEGLWMWVEKSPSRPIRSDSALAFNKLIRLEPSARAIHKRVIRYSGTGNGKIKRWQTQSRVAALLPNVSAGKDWGTSNNIDLDRAGTNDPDRFIDGPWNRDRGADIGFSWDLGNFIFSSSQTSIDSRSKLMVDQRNDLLSEATRLFYERRRLQAEIVYTPAVDEKSHWDRLLRLEELTALIDTLTDGYLSKQLERIYTQNPDLEVLWRFENHEPRTMNQGKSL
ncbi:MAG TPA: hypothetical protein DIS66_03965 [Candidatus Omnitrophica bacterium]|nr:hypothetical protein [Candidatus Omnitrophota bacterium]